MWSRQQHHDSGDEDEEDDDDDGHDGKGSGSDDGKVSTVGEDGHTGLDHIISDDGSANTNEEEVDEGDGDQEETLSVCRHLFSQTDFIMEADVMSHLTRYFSNGGDPLLVINLLSSNYEGAAQCDNLMANWLLTLGVSMDDVKDGVEEELREVILKSFQPETAERIFTESHEAPVWLTQMVKHKSWRQLFYQLAERHPDCITVKYCIKLISDHGFQREITSESTASHQIEVFSRVLKSQVAKFFEANSSSAGGTEDGGLGLIPEIAKMVCHGEHTYIYTQVLLHALTQQIEGSGTGSAAAATVRRLGQEIEQAAASSGYETSPVTLSLSGAAAFPRACQAIAAMMKRNALNPADITVLYKMYHQGGGGGDVASTPPVDLLRTPLLIELFLDALYKPGSAINPEHKNKYLYLLAYVVSVTEKRLVTGSRRGNVQKDEFDKTLEAIERTHQICQKNSADLLSEIKILFQCLRYPIVAAGILRWLECVVLDSAFFKLSTDTRPSHLLLLDEVASLHRLLQPRVMNVVVKLLDLALEELENLVQLELRRTFIDRLVHLLSRGYALPVIEYVVRKHTAEELDVSLVRHFVSETLDIVAPPYSKEFIDSFSPLIASDEITGSLHIGEDSDDPVREFLAHMHV